MRNVIVPRLILAVDLAPVVITENACAAVFVSPTGGLGRVRTSISVCKNLLRLSKGMFECTTDGGIRVLQGLRAQGRSVARKEPRTARPRQPKRSCPHDTQGRESDNGWKGTG